MSFFFIYKHKTFCGSSNKFHVKKKDLQISYSKLDLKLFFILLGCVEHCFM